MIWGEHIYTYDYNVYLSKIRQGMEGRWTIVDKYTNDTNQKGVLLQMLYLLTGKVGGLLHLDPTLSFHLVRVILSLAFVLTVIALNVYFLRKPVLYFTGTLITLLASSFPVFYYFLDQWWVGQYMPWWQEMDVLKRLSYLPHYLLNYIIIGLFAILISQNTKHEASDKSVILNLFQDLIMRFRNPLRSEASKFGMTGKFQISDFGFNRNFFFTCVLLFFSFFIHPAGGFLFFISWGLYHFIKTVWFRSYEVEDVLNIFKQTMILLFVAAVPLLYIKFVTSTYPWKTLIDFDRDNRLAFKFSEYILSLGPVFFTGLLGTIVVLWKKDERFLSLATWFLGAFLGIVLFQHIPFQSELRFAQTANHIPLAILTIYFLNEVKNLILKKKVKISVSNDLGIPERSEGRAPTGVRNTVSNFLFYGVISLIIGLGIVQAYFSIKAQTDFIHQRAVAGVPLVPYPPQVMYPLNDFYNAMIWLKDNTARTDVVLSKVTAGNYIPAYSGNYVYLGHNPETPMYSQKVDNVNQFFSGTMIPKDAQQFLKTEHISYVFYGPQEKDNNQKDIKQYSFLKEVFTSPYVTLYRVI
jgi:hypothetical protein